MARANSILTALTTAPAVAAVIILTTACLPRLRFTFDHLDNMTMMMMMMMHDCILCHLLYYYHYYHDYCSFKKQLPFLPFSYSIIIIIPLPLLCNISLPPPCSLPPFSLSLSTSFLALFLFQALQG